jgi:hypothetical protein
VIVASLSAACSRSETSALAITQHDGTPVPAAYGYGAAIVVRAGDPEPRAASWSARGACTVRPSASIANVDARGLGRCTVTASVKGATATVTFAIAPVTEIQVLGVDAPLTVGEPRTITVAAKGPSPDASLVSVRWNRDGLGMGFDVEVVAPNQVQVTANAVSTGGFAVSAGEITKTVNLSSNPASIRITTTSAHPRAGDAVQITALPFDVNGDPCRVITTSMWLDDAGCFSRTTGPDLGEMGVVFGGEIGATDCPAVTVRSGTVVSNALAFDVPDVASVSVEGQAGPVFASLAVSLRAVARDADGGPFAAGFAATFADAAGVFSLTKTGAFTASAIAMKTGTGTITATVNGVVSAPYSLRVVPGAIQLASGEGTIAVGEKASATVTVMDVLGHPLTHESIGLISLRGDATKVLLDAGRVDGDFFVFGAMGLAPTGPKGIDVVARWSDGLTTVDSSPWTLVVTDPAGAP